MARERKYTPHSLRAHLESLATHGTATGRARAELLLRACGEDDADNGAMGEVFDAYVRHAARLNGGEGVAESSNLDELPRARGQRGELLPTDACQTSFLGERRVVGVPQLGGGVEMEERSCTGLAPSTARDAALCLPGYV